MQRVTLRIIGVLAVSLLAQTTAFAQPISGLYFGGNAGVTLPQGNLLPAAPARPTIDPGPAGHASVGYGFADKGLPFRIEVEGSLLHNRLN